MTRREFTRKIRAEASLRSAGKCELCRAYLKVGEAEYDHVLPCELGGEATLENCQVLCRFCHAAKTKADVGRIRKADRQRDKASGAFKKSSRPLPGSRGTPFRKRMDGTVERRET